MSVLASGAALLASVGWASAIVLAERPARALGAFDFTRIQLIICATAACGICTAFGLWQSVQLSDWPAYAVSACVGVIIGNLAMVGCLRLGGPRRAELLVSMKALVIGVIAFFWFGELPDPLELLGAALVLIGILLAIAPDPEERRHAAPLWQVIALGVIATVSQSLGFLVVKPALTAGADPIAVTAIRLSGAAVLIALAAPVLGARLATGAAKTPGMIAAAAVPGLMGYVLCSSLLLYALANMDAAVASVLGSLSPVLVLPILWRRNGARPTARSAGGALACCLGIALILSGG
ncbi:DMT family transporter [uncultured Sulfitobacter sp.]|uniref:DMT family transporter n=1 Tax=uncultured Sulfitobacter sp. TaxID=191468 RepID=UPI00261697CC|nr:DMT family transporter [uncultured Sulfitobacter sp.]